MEKQKAFKELESIIRPIRILMIKKSLLNSVMRNTAKLIAGSLVLPDEFLKIIKNR